MTLELWNTFATFGTFVVIAATAIAALVQLRHARSSYQIAALAELQAESATPRFEVAVSATRTELRAKLEDPEFRYQLSHRSVRTAENRAYISKVTTVGDLYEVFGLLVKNGLLDRELALDFWAARAAASWANLAPATALLRREQGDTVWENFEYVAVLAQDWLTAHPTGAYPVKTRRIGLKDEWLEADRQYEASRAPA